MSNYMQEAFGPAEAKYKSIVMQDTWGHLAPTKNTTYKGEIVFAESIYGDMGVLKCDFKSFKGKVLDDSPWFYECLYDFLWAIEDRKEGVVYKWTGKFKNYEFTGRLEAMFAF